MRKPYKSSKIKNKKNYINFFFFDGVSLNSLPNNKILDWSKLKAFADDKINVTENLKFVLRNVENIVEKGKNAGYQHFHLLPRCFKEASFSGSLKVGIVW